MWTMTSITTIGCVTLLSIVVLCIVRLRRTLPGLSTRKVIRRKTARTLVVLGSGGHTGEMMYLMRSLNRKKFRPLHIVYASSDSMSRVRALSEWNSSTVSFHSVPRSRSVGQSWITTPFTTAWAIVHSILLIVRIRPDTILCNGPGTCVPICYAAFLLRFLGLQWCDVVFVESFCRSKSLSLSGRLLYPIADVFVVHWKKLATRLQSTTHPRIKYVGLLY